MVCLFDFSSTGNSISNSIYGERYPSFEAPRADNGQECFCVPFDQCLPHEVISRKEDGYAIDPRNSFKANIEAIGPDDVVITDGNGTVVSVKKLEEITAESSTEEAGKSRRRRESEAQAESKIEPVSWEWIIIASTHAFFFAKFLWIEQGKVGGLDIFLNKEKKWGKNSQGIRRNEVQRNSG